MTCVASCARLHGDITETPPILFWRLSKAHARSATVLVDELDAGGLQGSQDCGIIGNGQGSRPLRQFRPSNSYNAS
jgi:hypothetical protein